MYRYSRYERHPPDVQSLLLLLVLAEGKTVTVVGALSVGH